MSDMNKSKRQIRDDSWNFDETTGWLIRSEGKEVWRREIKSSVWNGLSSRCPLASIPCQVNGWIEAKGPGMKSALGGLQNPMHNRRNSWDPLPAQVPVQPLLSLSSSSSWQRSMRALLPHSIAPTPTYLFKLLQQSSQWPHVAKPSASLQPLSYLTSPWLVMVLIASALLKTTSYLVPWPVFLVHFSPSPEGLLSILDCHLPLPVLWMEVYHWPPHLPPM